MKKIKVILSATLLLTAGLTLTHAANGASDETPPPAEAPYPNAPEEGFAQKPAPRIPEPGDSAVTDALIGDPVAEDVSNEPLPPPVKSKRVKSADTATMSLRSAPGPDAPVPVKKNRDGSWNYGKATSDDHGEYRYKSIKAKEINYNEHDKPPGSDHSSFFRFAYFGAPDIQNADNKKFFHDIYGAQSYPSALFDYEWKITHKIGDVGIKIGSGVFYAQGTGRWADPNRQRDSQQPLEKFTFFMLPNTVSGIYRFKYSDRQVLVPYGEAGPGFFTFMETRDDSKGPKFGGAAAAFFAGGLNVLIDGADRNSMKNLRQDYGINHLYLNLEYRAIVGLNRTYDFGSRVLAGGLGAEF